jgi:hypothetical protein
VLCRIHTVLTDNGTQFVDRTPINDEADACWVARSESPALQLRNWASAQDGPAADSPAYFNLPRRSFPAVAQRGIFG